MADKKERLIIESESDTRKLIELRKRIAELEEIIGQKQIEIEFKNKMIDLAEEIYGVDIKKNFLPHPRILLVAQGKLRLQHESAI